MRSISRKILLRYIMIVFNAGRDNNISASHYELLMMGIEAKMNDYIRWNVINQEIKEQLLTAIVNSDLNKIESLI